MAPESAIWYAVYGLIFLCSVFNDIDSGYKFGKLSLELVEKYESTQSFSLRLVILLMHLLFTGRIIYEKTLSPLKEAYQDGSRYW